MPHLYLTTALVSMTAPHLPVARHSLPQAARLRSPPPPAWPAPFALHYSLTRSIHRPLRCIQHRHKKEGQSEKRTMQVYRLRHHHYHYHNYLLSSALLIAFTFTNIYYFILRIPFSQCSILLPQRPGERARHRKV